MSEQINNPPQASLDSQELFRRRNAVWIAVVTGIVMFIITAVTLPAAFQIGVERIWGPIITAVTTVVALISAFLSSRGKPTLGSGLIIAVFLFLSFGVTFLFANDQGTAVAAIAIFVVSAIASYTMPPYWASRLIGVSIVLGVLNILADFYLPNFGIPSDPRYTNIIAIVISVIYTILILRQFDQYSLRNKLILSFTLVAVFSVAAVTITTNALTQNVLTQQVGQAQQDLARQLAFETGQELEANVEILLSAATQFEEVVASFNDRYEGEQNAILEQILKLDNRWRAAADSDSLIQDVIDNEISNELREFQQRFPTHVELFLTDKYGANLAATNRTTDYYQSDEAWWQSAFSQGAGKIFIGQPEFDESSQTYSIIIALPLYQEGQIAGILRSTLAVTPLLENLTQVTRAGTTEIDLRLADDTILAGDPLIPGELPGIQSVMGKYGQITYKGEPSLVSQQRVFSAINSSASEAITNLGWSVIVHRDLNDALQPVQRQTRVITLIALLITALVSALGLVAAQRLAAPILSLTEVTRKVSEGDLDIRAQIQTQDEIGALSESFNLMTSQLQEILDGLERRVADRTADLEFSRQESERRAQELQAISEISRTISTEQRLEILLPLVARLVSERFDFYHTGIFFVDDIKQFAVLQAANSEGGKRMLARGHRLGVGTGLVGTVVKTGKPRIALDVGADAVYFDNPDLPETRSEMALPLNFRGQTIGVLDVQSLQPGAFTEEDASTLGILADQIAIAIENARLFSQTQQAREEAEALYNQFLRTEWKTFLQQNTVIGYQYSASGGREFQKPVQNAEIRQALQEGQVVVLDQSKPVLAMPMKLRGQTIGVLNITASKNRKWSQDEIALTQAISDRLALALDNARLLLESQRRAAKEAKISEVTARIGASINMRNVLQTAVEELGRALPGSEIVIQFQNSQEN